MDEYHPGIVDRFPLCMALLDRDLVIRAWNRCMEELLSRPTGSAVGLPLGHLPEFKKLPIRTAVRRVLAGEPAVYLAPRGGANGRGPLAAGLSLAPLRGPDGAISGFLMTVSRPPATRKLPPPPPPRGGGEVTRWRRVGRAAGSREAGRLALLGAVSELTREAWEEPGPMLQAILGLLATEVSEEALAVLGVRPGESGLVLLASRGLSGEVAAQLPAAATAGLLGRLLRQGVPVFQGSTGPAGLFTPAEGGLAVRSLVAVPIRSREGLAAVLCCL
ncbi:MAG TPA: PAS domain-containing protein, partial [Candidatus Methylomirabilis sp.]|nr:PAS domain-containing protein [Candidatus Methylomirabilis sp.]